MRTATTGDRSVRARWSTASLRLRLTASVLAVLAVVLLLLGIVVDATFAAQSERNLDTLLSGRAQLARQLARSGVGPQQVVNRVDADGVRPSLTLRNGDVVGTTLPVGDRVRVTRTTLTGPGRIDQARLTLAVDTALVADARASLRRTLLVAGLAALLVGGVLVAVVVRLALGPLRAMGTLATSIAAGRRGARLTPPRADTEIGRTAAAFDAMLDELEGAESRARTAEERTRTFLADAAHEMRTPVAGVQVAAETLLQHGASLDPTQRARLETLLLGEAEHAGRLVTDLLATARLDADLELRRTPVPLDVLVRAESDRVRLLHPDVRVEVLTGSGVTVDADADRINDLLRNVVDNALHQVAPDGRIRLSVRTQQLTGEALYAVVEVLDSGPGIAVEDRERVFDRLVRLDSGRDRDRGGSGLGLAIARGYARAHGGDLTCEDPGPGGGALFRLTLPL